MRRVLAVVAVLLFSSAAWSQEGRQGYYRHPTLHDGTLVFAAEGDLWKVAATGGLAQRLTTHAEEESHPTISGRPHARLWRQLRGRYRGVHDAAGGRAAEAADL